jgi:hypoxanthine phosphoribosyltransferase
VYESGVVEMKKTVYTWDDVKRAATSISLQMYADNWRPDYIVGITRGGLPIAVMLSHMLDVRMHTLDVRLRDGKEDDCESNLWLAEWAFGYNDGSSAISGARWDPSLRKNILLVDCINDTGATFDWIKKDWQGGCLPNETNAWDAVWNKNVKFATMTENYSSNFTDVDYSWHNVDKNEDNVWLVYPWEET